jgi:hypothetical protein
MPSFYQTPDTSVTPAEGEVPSYLLAADNHNLGNSRGGSWLDMDTWGDKFQGAGRLIATGMLSGANSFYNTGVTIGNWFGAEAELNDTKDWISGIDSDLGSYYSENRQAADLVGFVASSILPGIAGIKVLNAGQSALRAASARGILGENLSKATGLLVPQTEKYIALAAQDITAAQATFSSINQAGVKALASGVWQNTLEAAAFETAVQATMFKSPILDGQDGWDIAKNIAIGGAVGGVIGGAFAAAGSLGRIKGLVKEEELRIKPFSDRVIPEKGTSPAERIMLFQEDREFARAPNLAEANYDVKLAAHTDKLRRIDNDIRTAYHEMVIGKDVELGNMIADAGHALDSRTTLNNLLGAQQITRVGQLTDVEKATAKAAKEGKVPDAAGSVQYVKLTGEGAGVVSDSEPLVLSLADRVKVGAGQTTRDKVFQEVREQGFKPGQNWSVLGLKGANIANQAEARHIWADSILKEIKDGTGINQFDIPVLERAYKDGILNIKLVDDTGSTLKDTFASKQELWNHIRSVKDTAANELLRTKVLEGTTGVEHGTEAISKIVNVKLARLEGTAVKSELEDYQAWQSGTSEYRKFLESKGLATPANAEADPRFLPTYAKISKSAPDLTDIDGHVIDGMTYIKTQQSLIRDAVNNVVSKATGDIYATIPEITDSSLLTANRYGAGAGLISFANGGYGSLESTTQLLGTITKGLKVKFRGDTETVMQGPLFKLLQNQEAAIEWSTLNQKVSRSGRLWVRHTDETGDEFLAAKDALAKYTKEGVVDYDSMLASDPEALISLKTPAAIEAVDSHIARTGSRTATYRELRAAQGLTDQKDPAVFRPIRPNPKDYPYFAFVKDPRVTGSGHTTMVFANSEGKLQELIGKVPPEYQVLTKRDTEDFFRARGEYEHQRTLSESYIDSDLKNRGIYSDFFTKTDPQKLVDDALQQHLREDDTLAMELMRAKNQKAFSWLEDQGDAYTKVSASKFGSYSDRLEQAGKNPYLDYIKTALDISKVSEYPLLAGFNRLLDGAVSRGHAAISSVFNRAKSPEDLAEINQLIDRYGMNTGYRDAATDLLVNHTAPKGELTKFVRTANAILSKLTLGLDPLNALNNMIGANILRGTELKQITDAIKAGDTKLAGELGNLSKVQLPGVTDSITAPSKLVARAISNFVKDDGTLTTAYKSAGYIKDASEQFRQILDDFTLRGTESVSELNTRVRRAFDRAKSISELGEKLTGNKFAEEFNRFISADVMRQLTEPAVSRGLLTQAEAGSYINTFVNRVEGNTIASQRPLMFQGPIGQAIGLFQSYQFNLMQQMFRYIGEGTGKDAAMLLGLQGTFYGLQGLPAFQFINQHVVGTLSGNQKHVDLYDSTLGVAGKQMGELLLYGLPSNILQTNLYSRGDINPRQVTVIPTSLPDVPFIGAFGKFLGSVKETVGKIGQGGAVWESLLQGLEHNGLSRPLAGMAQTLQAAGPGGVAYSTTSKGSILFSNDFASWATASRIAGGRPLDEAVINDATYRIQSYQALDRAKMLALSETTKSAVIQGNKPDESSLIEFAKHYAQNGGKQANFNKWMMEQYKSANTNQAEKIMHQLQNPFAQKMQVLMGGGSDSTPVY